MTNKRRDATGTIEFFVSPEGNDRWSGRLAIPNARRTDGPLATIEAAQRAVRALKGRGELAQPVRVNIRKGNYFLKRPLLFTPADSGLPDRGTVWYGIPPTCPVTYAAFRHEKPVISGGRAITGFKIEQLAGRTVWVADIPEVKQGRWYFRQLWVDGRRCPRPTLPREGFFRIERVPGMKQATSWNDGRDRFVAAKGDIRNWRNLSDVEMVLYNFWIDSHMWIKSFDRRTRLVKLDRTSTTCLLDEWQTTGGQYKVENVFEALEQPGEWYLDRTTGKLYYLPRSGECLTKTEIIAPVLPQLVRLEGKSTERQPVEAIRFEGLTFAHTEWQPPAGWAASHQGAQEVSGVFTLRHARQIEITRCTLTNVGTYGIELLDGGFGNRIVGNDLTDLGAGGIKIWHGVHFTTVTDNEIGDAGNIYHSGIGVLIGKSTGNSIIHNHIHKLDYSGVSVGWYWGYQESQGYGNIIEYNHIHDIGHGKLSDMGGIYTLGVSTGTRLRYNLIHDIESRTYGGWGMYTDEGSTNILIENNIAYNTKCGGFHQHYGRDNIVRNNILAYARDMQLARSRLESHISFVFERNIVLFRQGDLWHGNWAGTNVVVRQNLYFDETGRPFVCRHTPAPKKKFSFKAWQKLGFDTDSIVANPRFADPHHGDFRLAKNSPAFQIGFQPFDLSTVGPRGEFRRDPGSPTVT